MTELTKSYKYLESFEDGGVLRNSYGLKVKLAWATLHSSERAAIRENGYVWLGDLLLIAEINDDGAGFHMVKHKEFTETNYACFS